MMPKFQPDDATGPDRAREEPTLIDPEAYDASEQQFAASLDTCPSESPPPPAPLPEHESQTEARASVSADGPETQQIEECADASAPPGNSGVDMGQSISAPAELAADPQPDLWQQEVSARLSQYRARRHPRGPRYPSLQLKFESPPARSADPVLNADAPTGGGPAAAPANVPDISFQQADFPPLHTEYNGRIIEFPRSSLLPPGPLEELAEPMLAVPRILEVPESSTPPPALGGILIEPEEEKPLEKRPGFEIPLQQARLWRRMFAAAVDAILVLAAVAALGGILYKTAGTLPPLRPLLVAGVVVTMAFWAMYQYLLLVHSATTPGLRLARLQLSRFDGSPAPRAIRRWRVMASILSGASLGLGYGWCLLDEDSLCWHDRITRTYLAPVRRNSTGSDAAVQ
jgi:uncharacterized RDD family membrane protein YckC